VHIAQSERHGRFLHITQHPPEELFVFLAAYLHPRLRHEVAKRQRRGQSLRLPQQVRLNFLYQHFQRSVVG
jgi:hypothetical protein